MSAGGLTDVSILRSILAALLVLAIAVTPIGSALAGLSAANGKVVTAVGQSPDTVVAAQDRQTMDMADCDQAMHGTKTDCPCCDSKGVCPPDLCPLKVVKILAFKAERAPWIETLPMVLRPVAMDRPPEWRARPQPPPPRT